MTYNKFIGTLNNIEPVMCESYLEKWHTTGCEYVTGQLEKGKEGTVHLQFFLNFGGKAKKRISALKKHCPKAHFEPVKKDNGAAEYCNKDETRIDGPWSYGIKPARQDKKGDVARRNMDIKAKGASQAVRDGDIPIEKHQQVSRAIAEMELEEAQANPYCPGHDRGVWIYGPSRTGKSTYAREKYPDAYEKLQTKWWDGYTGQKAVILDDYDTDTLGHHLKRWMDVHPCTGESKGKHIPLKHDYFIITSNYSIEELFIDKPKWVKPLLERCKGRIHHFTNPFDYLTTDRNTLPPNQD